jgi:hypothetical protein
MKFFYYQPTYINITISHGYEESNKFRQVQKTDLVHIIGVALFGLCLIVFFRLVHIDM